MKDENNIANLTLLNIGYAVHHADWNYKDVSSPFARIYLVKEGKAKLNIFGKKQELTPNNLYIIPPFTLHSYECDDYYALYYIHVYENHFDKQRVLEDYFFPTEVPSSQLTDLLVEQLFKINPERELSNYDPMVYDNSDTLLKTISLHSKVPFYANVETEGILMQLLSQFLREASHKFELTETRIKKVLRHIRMNVNEPLKISDLSDLTCLTKDHFIRLFKKELTVTPTQYINQKKIERAQLQLVTTNLSIKDIAYGLSFEDVSYFNRLFKQHTGMTPKEYRENT